MIETDVVPGVHRIEDSYTNWYLVEQDGRLTIVDCGVPTSWSSFEQALERIGRSKDDVEAVVLTHAHFDHVGFAERARTELKVPVYVHREDVALTKHPSRYEHERPRALYLATEIRALPIVTSLVKSRAFWPKPVEHTTPYENGSLPVPGEPRVVFSPGHTFGHCALHLPDRDVLIAGDAIVMLDPYTGKRGPRLVARAATANVESNMRSLDGFLDTGAKTVLTGHGEPWRDGVESAVAQAREAGAA
jgi:glyoxylase-like metal-dependent hydrolase (beta-lactamase superfamily II)